jgi:hypothetical protein
LREKLLLRQIEVLLNYPENKVDFNEISFQINEEDKVLNLLRNYGVYSNIDCFLPYLENENEENENFFFEKPVPSVIDNKRLNSSIINLTLKESQNLITKSTDLVASVSDKLKADLSRINRQQCGGGVLVEEKEVSHTDTKSIKQKNEVKAKQSADEIKLKRNDTTTSSKKKTLKNISNLTLNSCGGNIILKNISNLTINGCKSTSQSQQHSSKVESVEKPCTDSKCEGNYYQCDFYERLISENEVLKRSIVNQSLCTTTCPDPITTTCMSPTGLVNQPKKSEEKRDNETFSINSTPDETMTSITTADDGISAGKSCCNEAIEEITTATMRVDGFSDHSPMIQCWLSKMLNEPETESQNIAEFLEISNIM